MTPTEPTPPLSLSLCLDPSLDSSSESPHESIGKILGLVGVLGMGAGVVIGMTLQAALSRPIPPPSCVIVAGPAEVEDGGRNESRSPRD